MLGSGTLAGGKVTIPTGAFDTAGTKTLTAVYAGDATDQAEHRQRRDRRRRPAAPATPAAATPATEPALAIRGGKADANRRRRTAAIRVRCSGARACAGTVRLRVGKRTLGTGRSGRRGRHDTIRVKLNRKARKLLAQQKRARRR